MHDRAGYDICMLCWWEDDGQGDSDATEVRGGPNEDLSLASARANFLAHLTMFDRGHDTRSGGEDTAEELEAKRRIIRGFQLLEVAIDAATVESTWAEIDEAEWILRRETERRNVAHERSK